MCVRLRVEEERGREIGGIDQSEEKERERVGITHAAPVGCTTGPGSSDLPLGLRNHRLLAQRALRATVASDS